ncbi:major facilitator superfamily domain-containing protein [Podospora didyma]|uniref:Major facilitator superfamily domain-containing protein n=1 Tax=Podospora didyma TaxID=330526 RepID=A0AAE0N2D6_9PEZI|nr:major facilitator superfamily domain-containing protein [Podospora didyma]
MAPQQSSGESSTDLEKISQDVDDYDRSSTSLPDSVEKRLDGADALKEEERQSADGDDDVDNEEISQHSADGEQGTGLAKVISRVLSRTSTKSLWNPGPPPDGGLKAWTTVACAHLVVMNTWGFINSFGVFQAYYTASLARPPADISWIGSVQIFLLFFVGTFTGRLTDAGYFRHIFLLGCIFQVIGIFTLAAVPQPGSYWQVFLAQGVCMGLGNGCLFCPCMTTVSTYFSKKRSLAIGIVACGSATGGLVFPTMVRQLLPSVGFAWTVRAIGFIQVVTLFASFLGIRPRIPPRKTGPVVDWMAFRELEYMFYALGSFCCFLGIYFAFYYVASFSRDIIGLSYTESLNLLLVMNGVGVIGRLGPNHMADRVGPINVFIPIAGIAGICVFCWMVVHSIASMYVWACFYGMAAGGIQSLFPAGLSSLTTDLRKAGVRMGMVFTISSFATLTGPPIAGAILTASGGRYVGAQAFAGSTLLMGMGFMAAARAARGRRENNKGWRVKV